MNNGVCVLLVVPWRKASRTYQQGDCVEVAVLVVRTG